MTEKLELKINTNIDELKSKINQFEKLAEEIENFKLEITHSKGFYFSFIGLLLLVNTINITSLSECIIS
ncbi:hypothetical protein BXQ17_07865 [Polaribacter sp. BM10]|uniref:hypothetical protein n=1 Tax=Polaribacter sp. BM10 TaxID=1529069 RepID=UPI00098A015B|nr:hypothetical protein [Polaribacter sp. BM10]AQS93981.1 hypothetical protein BXQ17_07865 [Polaribacter sp. BM10]